jgi:diguanylate cyclase (GGDEF)-like protein/PAS domain S-box-containing protein
VCLGISAIAVRITHLASRQRQRENSLALAVHASEERFSTIFHSVNDGIFLTDLNTGRFVDVNQPGCAMFGYMPAELVGSTVVTLSSGIAPYTQAGAIAALAKARSGGPHRLEWHCKRKDGSLFWVDISLRSAAFATGPLGLAVARDITRQKQAIDQIAQMARFDPLTALVNRRVFVETLEHAIARARRTAQGFAVLYLDLDHFKDVNDTLGHSAGDLLLQAVAERLRASVRATDMVARFGGDEFAVLVSDLREPADAVIVADRIQGAIGVPLVIPETAANAGNVADKILTAVGQPFSIQGNQIRSGATVGIAVYGPDSPDPEALLSHADEALYRAKSDGRGTYRFFTDAMDTEIRARVRMSRELREAISAEQLYLLYQPEVDIDTGRIVGLEALVHWRHPTRGDLGPSTFIEAAEANGLIVPLGRWVMREACRQAKQWSDAGIAAPLVAINVSGVQLKMPRAFEQEVATSLAEAAIPASCLELELTESVLMQASREHNDLLLRLRSQGVRIAIDDFGTGYSSLDYLRRFPVDRLKIAQSFVLNLGKGLGEDAIVRAALGLARELGIEVVVEGVEDAVQLKLLKSWGCRVVQGFYYARPLAVADVSALLRSGTITPERSAVLDLAAAG